jgi:hypothetical protein
MKLKTRRTLGGLCFVGAVVVPLVSASARYQDPGVCKIDQLSGTPCPPSGPAPTAWGVAVVLVLAGLALYAPWLLHWLIGKPPPSDPPPDGSPGGQT